jgi:peroxiredoxin Q/BCP
MTTFKNEGVRSIFDIGRYFLIISMALAQTYTSGASAAQRIIEPGDKAPDWSLTCDRGHQISLQDFHGKNVVLFFYDKDKSQVTKEEMKRINRAVKKFNEKGLDVVGIGDDPVASHKSLNLKMHLQYRLLSDEDNCVRKLYGLPFVVNGEKGRFGIIIDQTGVVRKVQGGDKGIDDNLMTDFGTFADTLPAANI